MSAASGGNSEPKQGQRSQSARAFAPEAALSINRPRCRAAAAGWCLSRKAEVLPFTTFLEVLPIPDTSHSFNCVYLRTCSYDATVPLPDFAVSRILHQPGVTVAVGGQVENGWCRVPRRRVRCTGHAGTAGQTGGPCCQSCQPIVQRYIRHTAKCPPPVTSCHLPAGWQRSLVSTFRLLLVPVRSQKRCMPPDWKVLSGQ